MIRIGTITIEAACPRIVAEFWAAVLGYQEVAHPTDSIRLDDPTGSGPTLLIQPGQPREPSRKNRIHFDLRPDDQARAVDLAVRHGASRRDVGQTGGESWVVLADPEGNEFCVLQSLEDLERNQ